jgi:hypothetical protein
MFLAWLVVVLVLLRAGDPAFHHADRVQADHARRLRAGAVRALEQDRVPRRKGLGQRGGLRRQGAGAGRDRRYRLGPVRSVPSPSRRAVHRPRAGHHAGLAHLAGARDLRPRHRHGPRVRCAAARRGRDGRCCCRRCRHGRGHRRRRDGRGRRRGCWRAHGPGCRQAGRQRCARRHVGGQQCEVGVPGRFRRRWRRRKGRDGGPGQRRQDRRAVQPDARAASRAPLPGSAWPLPSALAGMALRRWRRGRGIRSGCRRRGRRPAPLPRRRRNSPLGPSACIAASNSPMPRPPPPTRCAVAMAAAPARGRACAIPIHKEN